jgi:hypothetical protein
MNSQIQWYQNTTYNAVWSLPIPSGHSSAFYSAAKHPPPSTLERGATTPKRRKPLLGTSANAVPDFVNSTPLVEAVVPFTSHRPMTQQLLTQLARTPFPKFNTSTGMLTMCFLSAFAQPHNCCVLHKYMDCKCQCCMHVDTTALLPELFPMAWHPSFSHVPPQSLHPLHR